MDWAAAQTALDANGYALLPRLLDERTCASLVGLWDEEARFRTQVDMARHRFGEGSYRYFAAPLPPAVGELRRSLYPPLARVANRWRERLGSAPGFPATLEAWLTRCAEQGQTRPTPLLLRYEAGGYNRLHQDRYGALAFPLQVTVLLSRPGAEFSGGEFLLLERRPRMQSRGSVVPLGLGDAVVFPNAERPVEGARGTTRAEVRHGVSEVRSGLRYALGIIFHDAE